MTDFFGRKYFLDSLTSSSSPTASDCSSAAQKESPGALAQAPTAAATAATARVVGPIRARQSATDPRKCNLFTHSGSELWPWICGICRQNFLFSFFA
jgi:hypothetical protein